MEKLYYNGNIIDPEDGKKYDWLLTSGKIIKDKGFSCSMPSVSKEEMYDLKGHTLIPALIDPHSHITAYAISLLQPNIADAESFEDILNVIDRFIKENNPSKDDFISCTGYDQNKLKENAHPTKAVIDERFKDYPVVLHHISGHMGVMNQKALDKLSLESETGLLQENDFISNIKRIPLPNEESIKNSIVKAQEIYASYGIATAQEGMIAKEMIPIFKMAENEKLFFMDVIGYADLKDQEKIFSSFPLCDNKYHNRLKLKGLKIFLDGSPQGRTAWMKEPYEGSDDYRGFPTMSEDDVVSAFKLAVKLNKQLIAHCNGDAAAEQLLTAASKAADKKEIAKIRPVVIHSQLLNPNIMPKLKEYGFILSFFPSHIYYWGETHIKNFGIKRAQRLSSLKSALNEGLVYTIHQDTPVLPPDLFKAMESSVIRKTNLGTTLGENEKLTPLEALRAVTVNAAYQYGEEDLKGSLGNGKLADLTILDSDPLETDPKKLDSIKVIATIKEGKYIYLA